MGKRKDAQIYIIGHKPLDYGFWDDELYTPIQVGDAEKYTKLKDDGNKDNVSAWNPIMAENTATYYLWKHRHPSKYKGQCQYRRRLKFSVDTDFDKMFEKCDVIAARPLVLADTLYRQYCACHSNLDMDMLEKILNEKYPDYVEDFDRYIKKGRTIFYSNGFVMRAEHYDQYAEWLFGVFRAFKEEYVCWNAVGDAIYSMDMQIVKGQRKNIKGNKYQRQCLGFLSERLFTLYILHNFGYGRIQTIEYTKYEGV